MKTTPPSFKFLHPAVLATLAVTIACGLSARPAQAGYIVMLNQVGPDVVATGTGAIDLTGLTFIGSTSTAAGVVPSSAIIKTGPTSSSLILEFTGVSGPTSFGSGGTTSANSGTGGLVGIFGLSRGLVVPV